MLGAEQVVQQHVVRLTVFRHWILIAQVVLVFCRPKLLRPWMRKWKRVFITGVISSRGKMVISVTVVRLPDLKESREVWVGGDRWEKWMRDLHKDT